MRHNLYQFQNFYYEQLKDFNTTQSRDIFASVESLFSKHLDKVSKAKTRDNARMSRPPLRLRYFTITV